MYYYRMEIFINGETENKTTDLKILVKKYIWNIKGHSFGKIHRF